MIKEGSKIKIPILSFLALALIILPAFAFFITKDTKPNQDNGVKGIQYITQVSARVGEYYLTLSGYTSPQALVILSSSTGNLSAQTTADQKGFFLFKMVFLPHKIGELSLISQDTDGLASPPVYLPEPSDSEGEKDIFIENILLPPTVSFSSGSNDRENGSSAAGKTFPNSKVLVYLYADLKTTLWQKIKTVIVKTVFAKAAPRLETTSNDNGEFEFSLPSVEPAEQKLFVASLAEQISLMTNQARATAVQPQPPETTVENYSPKSFTLTFETYSIWEKIAAWIILGVARAIIWLRANPTNIIWLEIPILFILVVEILLRGWIEKILSEEETTEILK